MAELRLHAVGNLKESQYHWAALMAVAVGKAPDHYRDDPKIAANIAALRGYLQSHYDGAAAGEQSGRALGGEIFS